MAWRNLAWRGFGAVEQAALRLAEGDRGSQADDVQTMTEKRSQSARLQVHDFPVLVDRVGSEAGVKRRRAEAWQRQPGGCAGRPAVHAPHRCCPHAAIRGAKCDDMSSHLFPWLHDYASAAALDGDAWRAR